MFGKIGIICVPTSVERALAMAAAADEAGLWGLGIGDSQASFAEVYVAATACLLKTSRLTVGPIVTNTITRHPSVHAAAARALSELAPGRYVLGLSSGHSSVRSIDSAPATARHLAADVNAMRAHLPADVRILIAADGPRMASVAGRCGDGLLIGAGLDERTIDAMREAALAARREAGILTPLEFWLGGHLLVVPDESALVSARAEITGAAVMFARRVFGAGFAGKSVPEQMQPILRERLPHYDLTHHGQAGTANPNQTLFAGSPEVEDYLVRRFTISGTPEMCREQVAGVVSTTGISNFWFSSVVADPVSNVMLAGEALSNERIS